MKFHTTAVLKRVIRTVMPPRGNGESVIGRFSVSHNTWQAAQMNHELNYWVHDYPQEVPPGEDPEGYYRRHYHTLNANMFTNLQLDCSGLRVLDVGCGPFGSLAYQNPRELIGIDPLASEYQRRYPAHPAIRILNCQAEHIPLLDHSIDAAYCVNMLDHCERPYEVLDEIHRVLRPGGYLALAVDIGGTPEHPCRLEGPDVSAALSGRYRVLELRCGTEVVTSWPADMQIPAIAFQGQKIDGDISPVAERND